jgi:ribosomal protein S18 acetylase RimI-like enzyme
VCGYVLGVLDSERFRQRFISDWLPPLQKLYPEPQSEPATWTRDEHVYYELHHPQTGVYRALEPYPSHLHIDLLPRAQGQGNGKRMMQRLLETLKAQGSKAVYLGMHPDNHRAFHFYQKMGFQVIKAKDLPKDTLYLGLKLT